MPERNVTLQFEVSFVLAFLSLAERRAKLLKEYSNVLSEALVSKQPPADHETKDSHSDDDPITTTSVCDENSDGSNTPTSADTSIVKPARSDTEDKLRKLFETQVLVSF